MYNIYDEFFSLYSWMLFYFLTLFFNLLLEIGEGREKERERNIDVREEHWLVASLNIRTGLILQPKHVPWLGIKPATFPLRDNFQPTEPHWSEFYICFWKYKFDHDRKQKLSINLKKMSKKINMAFKPLQDLAHPWLQPCLIPLNFLLFTRDLYQILKHLS